MVSRLHLVVVCAIVFSVLPGQRSEAAPAGARIGPTGVPTGAPPGSPATAQATPTQRRAREPKSDGGPDLPVALGFKLKAVREPEARPKQTAAARPEKKKGITVAKPPVKATEPDAPPPNPAPSEPAQVIASGEAPASPAATVESELRQRENEFTPPSPATSLRPAELSRRRILVSIDPSARKRALEAIELRPSPPQNPVP